MAAERARLADERRPLAELFGGAKKLPNLWADTSSTGCQELAEPCNSLMPRELGKPTLS